MWHVMAMNLDGLDPFLPPDTRPLIEDWLAPLRYRLIIKGPRRTKRGDFRPPQRGQIATLTVNSDLKPFQFLLTLTHEIAHLMVWEAEGNLRRPHGPPWKQCFGRLLNEVAAVESLPDSFRLALRNHAIRPKSCAERDQALMGVLRELEGDDSIWLDDVELGAEFSLEGRRFRKLKSNRTRCLCLDLSNGQKYRVSKSVAVVTPS
jgi:SprT protein